jgi:chromosomal replication initiation ATPase DnaA
MINSESVCAYCKQQLPKPKRKPSELYVKETEKLFEVSLKSMKLATKKNSIGDARGYLWFLLCIDGYWSLTEAATWLGNFHHTSVLYKVRKYGHEFYGTPLNASIEQIRHAHEKAKRQNNI